MLVSLIRVRIILRRLIIGVVHFLGNKILLDEEKLRPFECGFYVRDNRRSPFSMHFFLLSLIFLIFDVELVLIFPFFGSLMNFYSIRGFLFLVAFLVFLSYGLFYEWSQIVLEWEKY